MNRPIVAIGVVLVAVTFTGCLSWKSSLNGPAAPSPSTVDLTALDEARARTELAVSAETLESAIDAYREVLEVDPAQLEALIAIADHSTLMATAYTADKKGKKKQLLRALEYAELAMYTNPEFRAAIDQGEKPWTASHLLTSRELDAMQVWVTAILYYFKEVMSTPSRVINIRWIQRLEPVLTRMDQVDDDWVPGVTAFNWGFYYFILPKSLGGNRDLAADKFAEGVALGESRLFARWGRAKFFLRVTKNRAEFEKEMQWVAAQDPSRFTDPPQWKFYFQADARALLQDVDGFFARRP